MGPQDPNNILSAITTLAGNTAAPTPVAIPALNFTVPTDLPPEYQNFLRQAAQDPDIVNYYKSLLDYAKGDLTLAQQQLENDYQTGVRQTTDNLKASLQSLGLTFTQEQNQTQDTLNKRGIALTQGPNNTTQYAGGGQAATELGQLNTSQQLRQEAEQRSAQQGIENAGISRNKGLTAAGQQARNTVMGLQQQQQQDIFSRAQVPYQTSLVNKQIDAQKALANQAGGVGGGDSELQQLAKTNRNPVQETRYQQLLKGQA